MEPPLSPASPSTASLLAELLDDVDVKTVANLVGSAGACIAAAAVCSSLRPSVGSDESSATDSITGVRAPILTQSFTESTSQDRDLPSNTEIEEYMERHGLQEFLTSMVAHLARFLPPDPFEFLQHNLETIVLEHRAAAVRAKLDPKPVPPKEPRSSDISRTQQEQIITRLMAVLKHPDLIRTAAQKLFHQFSGDKAGLAQQEFANMLAHLENTWSLHRQDGVLMREVLKRWRFRTSAASGKRGLPLWPLSEEDFVNAFPSLLRAVRDHYVPIGGMLHRSMFIRQNLGSLSNKYEVGAPLGRGNYGEVFIVTMKDAKERRVCKRVRRQQQRVPKEELVDEVNLLRGLDHPHICKIFEYFESDEYVEMIMEPAFGGTLSQLIAGLFRDDEGELHGVRPSALTETWLATCLAQLCGALTYAHDVVGVIHKDLKSENVLLVGQPGLRPEEVLMQPVHAMLADFGIAEVFHPESVVINPADYAGLDGELPYSRASSMRRSLQKRVSWSREPSRAQALELGGHVEWKLHCSHAAGTPTYMSPEVFRGSFTEKCDIWSLGVMTFLVMTGELPYRGENLVHQIHIVTDPRKHPKWELLSKNRWSLGSRLLCQNMLSKDEGMRPSAAEAARDDWLLRTREAAQHDQQQNFCGTADIAGLQQQHLDSHLMRMARHCIASQLCLTPLHQICQRFKKYDREGDGMLSYLEMRQALEDLGINSDGDMERIIESLDSNCNGTIEYSEFLAGCLDLASEEIRKHLRSVFDVFDLDCSGAISADELRQVLTLGANPDSSVTSLPVDFAKQAASMLPDGMTVEELVHALDTNGTGQVEYEELERYLMSEHLARNNEHPT